MKKIKQKKENKMKKIIVLLFVILIFGCQSQPETEQIDTTIMEQVDTTIVAEDVFFIVEEMPEFDAGGPDKFMGYVVDNIRYPEKAVEENISGKVFVSFIIDVDGTLIDAKIVKGAHPLLNEEALRVVNSSPKWKAGKQRDTEVKVSFTFPINFMLQ